MDLQQIADKYKVNLDELKKGIAVEKEHDDGSELDVIDDETDLIKIALAHLKEDPQYYTKLSKIENELYVHSIQKIIFEELNASEIDAAYGIIIQVMQKLARQYQQDAEQALRLIFKKLQINKKEEQAQIIRKMTEEGGWNPSEIFGDEFKMPKSDDKKSKDNEQIDRFVDKIHKVLNNISARMDYQFTDGDRDSIVDYAIKQLKLGIPENKIITTIETIYYKKLKGVQK